MLNYSVSEPRTLESEGKCINSVSLHARGRNKATSNLLRSKVLLFVCFFRKKANVTFIHCFIIFTPARPRKPYAEHSPLCKAVCKYKAHALCFTGLTNQRAEVNKSVADKQGHGRERDLSEASQQADAGEEQNPDDTGRCVHEAGLSLG